MRANIRTNKVDDIRISACTITKNEEKNIERSIRSYKKYVDEIIIVDTGSEDRTVEIAEKLGAKVVTFEWCGDFSKAKNKALEYASGDWILFLDADEYFGENCAKNLRQSIVYANEHKKNTIFCYMNNLDCANNDKIIAVNRTARVFKAGFKWQFPVHEAAYFEDGGMQPFLVQKNILYINHLGYSGDIIKDKGSRNVDLILKSLKETDSPKRKAEYYFYLCDAYYSVDDYESSAKYGYKFLDYCRENNRKIEDIARRTYTNIYYGSLLLRKDPHELLPFLKEFNKSCPDYLDSSYALADVEQRLNLYADSCEKAQKAIKMIDETNGAIEGAMGSHRASIVNLLGRGKEGLLKDTEALDLYFKAANDESLCADAAFNLLRLVKGYPEDKLDEFVESLYIGKSIDKKVQIVVALFKNYMLKQVFKCYASIKAADKDGTLDAQISAYIMISKGLYKKAADLFIVVYKINKNIGAARNALICAVISKDSEAIEKTKALVSQSILFALGFSHKEKDFTDKEIGEISDTYAELYRMGKNDMACSIIEKIIGELSEKEIFAVTYCLFADNYAIDTALFTVKQAPLNAESYYWRGVCLYRQKKIYEAYDFLNLSKEMGCKEPAIDSLLQYIDSLKAKLIIKLSGEKKNQLKKETEALISSGDLIKASKNIEGLLCENPDAEVYTLRAVLFFYCGLYKEAAAAAECGLLKDSKNFDLLYNAGYIYLKLNDSKTAQKMFGRAHDVCNNSETRKALEDILGVSSNK